MPPLTLVRRRVTQACGIVLLLLAGIYLLMLLLAQTWSLATFIEALIFAALGAGLLLGNAFASRATALLLLLIAIALPIGYLNPFNASDMMAGGGTAPSVAVVLLWMVPLEILLLFIVWAVDPLRRRRGPAPDDDTKQ